MAKEFKARAAQARELRRFKQNLQGSFEQARPTHRAISAGHNLVLIDGQVYPAEGVEGHGAALQVVNVGTPAVARYAPAQRRSVVSAAGTGVGGSGGGSGGGGGDVPSPHDLDGPHHSGLLSWSRVNKSGSSLADLTTRNHNDLAGRGPNDHHNQVHVLATKDGLGPDHTISGASVGHVLRASGATTAQFAELQHDDLGGVTPDQHHNQIHDIVGSDHTIAGDTFDLVGAVGLNTLGLHTPSSNPGAAAKILRTDSEGNLALDTDTLVVSALHDAVWVNSGQPDGSAAMKVQSAVPGDVTLHLQQIPNQTERIWKVTNPAGDELIVLDSVGNLQSGMPGFVSGLSGWQMTPPGRLEALDGYFRGELHATVFAADELHANSGTQLISDAGKLENDVTTGVQFAVDLNILSTAAAWAGANKLDILSTAPDWAGAKDLDILTTATPLDISDPSSGHLPIFDRGEFVRVKAISGIDEGSIHVSDLWFQVNDLEDMGDYFRYWVQWKNGTHTTLRAGSGVVSWKRPGEGLILLTSDWNHAPYIDIFSVNEEPWGSMGYGIPHVRLGQLSGVGVDGVSGIEQYGLIAGTDLTDNSAPYIVASDKQVKLFKVDLTAHDGLNPTALLTSTGQFKLGKDIQNPLTTAFDFNGASGDLLIGRPDGNHVRWDAQTETLHVDALLTIGGYPIPSTEDISQLTEDISQLVDDVEDITKPGGLLDTAKTEAQEYANQRRVLAILGGSMTPIEEWVVWPQLTLRMGDGSTRTVSGSGPTGQFLGAGSERYFAYVDITGSGNLTMQFTDSAGSLGVNTVVLYVINKSSGKPASIVSAVGNTIIHGDNIITGTIAANHLVAGAVTAEKIWANNSIGLGVIGHINANGKAYGSSTAGFFLGHHAGAYKFDIGDGGSYLRWSGSQLQMAMVDPIRINLSGASGTYEREVLTTQVGTEPFIRKISINDEGRWVFTGHLTSAKNSAGDPIYDILGFHNIDVEGTITAGSHLTVGGNATVQGTSLFNNTLTATKSVWFNASAEGDERFDVNPEAFFHWQTHIAHLRLTNTADLYNAVLGPIQATYGPAWERWGGGSGEGLYYIRIGSLVHLYGWVKRKGGPNGGANPVATGLPQPTGHNVIIPARSSAPGIADMLQLQTNGNLVVLYSNSVDNNVFDLMFHASYRCEGFDAFPPS